MRTTLTASLLVLLTAPAALADNWGHWRGPTGNGTAVGATPPTTWSATENVKWKVPIPGRGSGSPVIWDDKVFVVTAVPNGSSSASADPTQLQQPRQRGGRGGRDRGRRGQSTPLRNLDFQLLCLNRADGSLLWKQSCVTATPHQGTHSTNGFASASPCTDGEHVYAHFGSRGLYCFTMDGNPVWKRTDFGKMNTRASFGEGSSPTIEGDMILVPWDHEGPSSLFALNKMTGATIWKTDREEPTCWATPLVVENDGKKQVIMNGQVSARAYDLESGEELWKCRGQTARPVATPVAADGLVFIGSGYQGSFLGAFKLDGSGNIESSKNVAWTVNRDTPDIASPLLSGGRLYYHKAKTGILTCLDAATGKPHYSASRVPDIRSTYASPVAAGGYVFLTGRSGTTVVIKDANELQVVASNSVGEGVDATPAPVEDQLFIRGEKHLFCISAN
ncbi:MAG: PQQ-binding-like beta-propeller repeat protein [Planctomycetota bacterium]